MVQALIEPDAGLRLGDRFLLFSEGIEIEDSLECNGGNSGVKKISCCLALSSNSWAAVRHSEGSR